MGYSNGYIKRQQRELRRQVSQRAGGSWDVHVKPRSKESTRRRIEQELSRDPRFKDIQEL